MSGSESRLHGSAGSFSDSAAGQAIGKLLGDVFFRHRTGNGDEKVAGRNVRAVESLEIRSFHPLDIDDLSRYLPRERITGPYRRKKFVMRTFLRIILGGENLADYYVPFALEILFAE
jgi:hypothetical protein